MLFKLVITNVKKSIKDYMIYFLTLVFGVCVFYMFNSIEAQQSIMNVTSKQQTSMKALTQIIGYISIFVSIILGFLIVYANNFLIKHSFRNIRIISWTNFRHIFISTNVYIYSKNF